MENVSHRLESDDLVTPFVRDQLHDRLSDFMVETIATDFPELGAGRVEITKDAVNSFVRRYVDRPVADNKGGLAFAGSLALFIATRLLAPKLIVESGVHKGHTTWVLREACPVANIQSFDIDLTNLVHRDASGALFGCDWTEHAISVDRSDSALAFFDDHISHARRIREAHERGFRWLIVDDNLPAINLYATGVPPVPTVSMLLDPSIPMGQEIRWRRHGKPRSFTMTQDEIGGAAALIEFARPLPDVSHLTRGGRSNELTLVRLTD